MKSWNPGSHSSFTSDIQCVWTDPEPERGSGLVPPREVGVTICTIILLGLERGLPLSSWPWSSWPGQFLPGSCLELASKCLQDVTSPLVSTDTSLVSWLVHIAFPFPLIHQIAIYLTTHILTHICPRSVKAEMVLPQPLWIGRDTPCNFPSTWDPPSLFHSPLLPQS